MSAHDQLVATANRRAEEILDLPADQRDDRYASMRAEHVVAAGALGIPDEAAQTLADQMDLTIKRLVADREGGGA